jgi:hypothetical protein
MPRWSFFLPLFTEVPGKGTSLAWTTFKAALNDHETLGGQEV